MVSKVVKGGAESSTEGRLELLVLQSTASRDDDRAEASGVAVVVRLLRLVERELLHHRLDVVHLDEADAGLAVRRGSARPPAKREALRDERHCKWKPAISTL